MTARNTPPTHDLQESGAPDGPGLAAARAARDRRALLAAVLDVLGAADVDDARRTAEWLVQHALGLSRTQLFAYPERPVTAAEAAAAAALARRRAAGEPTQYVLGEADFYGLTLRVTPAVLIPRPETEQVVEEALRHLPAQARVLDAGTGSGCIALAVQAQRPEAAVWGCDVSPEALAVARGNAERLGLPATFVEADLLAPDAADRLPGELDLLVSNPPYIPEAEAPELDAVVREHEPHTALFAPGDALVFYRALVRLAPELLKPGGRLVLETHADYGPAVRDLLAGAGFMDPVILDDLAGRPRIAAGTCTR